MPRGFSFAETREATAYSQFLRSNTQLVYPTEDFGSFENRVGQDAQAANPRSLAALIAWMLFVAGGGSRSRVFDRLSGDWRAIKRAPIALDRLPPPARLHPSDQGPRQGRAPLGLLHPLKIQKRFPPGLARPAAHETFGITPLRCQKSHRGRSNT